MSENKVLRINEVSGVSGLALNNESIPRPSENEVLIKMKKVGINRAELLFSKGAYFSTPSIPSKIGVEGAGVVEDIGSKVRGFSKGDEVCVIPNMDFEKYGVIGEYALAPKEAIVLKPKNLSWEEAASIWMGYPTAYAGLVNSGGLEKGKSQVILISAASSSVGFPAIQIAKAHGAIVIATSRTLDKKETLKDEGADYVLATSSEDWVNEVLDITKGRGFDIAFDPIAGDFTSKLAECAALGATIVTYGALDFNPAPPFPLFLAITKGLSIKGLHVTFHLISNIEKFEIAKRHILENIEKGLYRPKIDKTFSLEEVAEAYQFMESGKQEGKILINISK